MSTQKSCTWMFIEALFIIVLTWKQHTFPWLKSQTVVQSYHGILPTYTKEKINDICNNLDWSPGNVNLDWWCTVGYITFEITVKEVKSRLVAGKGWDRRKERQLQFCIMTGGNYMHLHVWLSHIKLNTHTEVHENMMISE